MSSYECFTFLEVKTNYTIYLLLVIEISEFPLALASKVKS